MVLRETTFRLDLAKVTYFYYLTARSCSDVSKNNTYEQNKALHTNVIAFVDLESLVRKCLRIIVKIMACF